jgi:hypothetical protein
LLIKGIEMAKYIIYNSTGRITRIGDCPDGLELTQLIDDTEFILIEEYQENTYIDVVSSTVVNKTEMPSIINKQEILGDGVDELIISNLFNLTDISIYGVSLNFYETYEVTDGSFDATFDEDGEYKIILSAVPFLDKEYIVTVT